MFSKLVLAGFVLLFEVAATLTAIPSIAAEREPTPLFSHSFALGRMTLSSGAGQLFALVRSEGTLFHFDPATWTVSPRLTNLSRPQDLAVGRYGNRILVDLDSSRTLLIVPAHAAGPPLMRTVGLNPGQIIKGVDDHYYLVARAVHIVYALDPDHYATQNWIAAGESFRRVSSDSNGHLWLPLNLSDSVMEVGTSPLASLKTIELDRCGEPVHVLSLLNGGFLVGCHDALLKMEASGLSKRLSLRRDYRRGVRDMLMLPGRQRFLALFRKYDSAVLFDAATLQEIAKFHFPFRPVRLYIFPNWPILFVVMNDPDHDKTWLFGYPLSIIPHPKGSSPLTTKSRKNT